MVVRIMTDECRSVQQQEQIADGYVSMDKLEAAASAAVCRQ